MKMAADLLIPQKFAKTKNTETKDVHLDTQRHADMDKNLDIKVDACINIQLSGTLQSMLLKEKCFKDIRSLSFKY